MFYEYPKGHTNRSGSKDPPAANVSTQNSDEPEICTDCRDRAKELNYKFVDLNLALEFISDLPPQ